MCWIERRTSRPVRLHKRSSFQYNGAVEMNFCCCQKPHHFGILSLSLYTHTHNLSKGQNRPAQRKSETVPFNELKIYHIFSIQSNTIHQKLQDAKMNGKWSVID